MKYRRVQESGEVIVDIDKNLLPKPSESGTLQRCSILIEERNRMLFFTIIAVDQVLKLETRYAHFPLVLSIRFTIF